MNFYLFQWLIIYLKRFVRMFQNMIQGQNNNQGNSQNFLQTLKNNSEMMIDPWVKQEYPPYSINTQTIFSFGEKRTYENMLRQYDTDLLEKIRNLRPQLLQKNVYVIRVQMRPDNKKWIIWKTLEQIQEFVRQFWDQIQEMLAEKERITNPLSDDIVRDYQFFKNESNVTEQNIPRFIQLLNKLGAQPYLRKTIDFLIFIEHCVSLDKWDLQIYQQIIVHKKLGLGGKIISFFKEPTRQRDYFLTLTNQGIMKSDNHLLESKIRQMIPFTNQMKIQRIVEDQYLSYKITSCNHEGIDINFYDDYVQAINFGCGLGKAMKDSNFTGKNRFDSFAQIRQNCDSKLYNDGFQYYNDLFEAISRAKFQICMTGWMFTPYFRLKRPGPISDKTYRLDGALQAAAQRGVRIYVIVFMQPKMFVNNDSEYVEEYFESLHKNIQVYRHPNTAIPGVWSHHQKMVVIDQKIGFMGGLDICYGRWDTPQHYIYDPSNYWDGCEYNNFKAKDIYQPRNYTQSNLNAAFQPRMGWHDIAIQLRGDSVIDLLRHFIQYWYFVQEQLSYNFFQFMHFLKARVKQSSEHEELAIKEQAKFFQKSLEENKEGIQMGMKQRLDKMKTKVQVFFTGQQVKINELFLFKRAGKPVGPETHQLCRSASAWTIGIAGDHEQSIHHAYIELIKKSKQFIYIENQFFMGLENKVVETLAERITEAHRNRKPFRVIVVMPLLPGFQGDITDPAAVVLRVQVHYQYQAINRSADSLFERLKRMNPGINIDQYVYFYGLRQSCKLKGVPVTEIIYVHSKLMIVDDERCIIGSANINDRSLLGNRDSQLAIVIEQKPGAEKILNLRARLFQQHFGLTEQENRQIMSPQIWNKVISNAKRNTEIYRTIFRCLPDDFVSKGDEAENFTSQAEITRYDQLKGQLFAHAVEWPLQFMRNEDLTPKVGQMEHLAPASSFT